MSNLIQYNGDEITADSRDIARVLNIQHHKVIELLNKYSKDYSELGQLSFKREVTDYQSVKEGKASPNPPKWVILNEDHCYLLITHVRNSEDSRPYKLKLIQTFKRVREDYHRKIQENAVVSLFLEEVPQTWQKRFQESFFEAVMECYGLEYIRGKGTPSFVGWFINTYIYNPLLNNLSDELKEKRELYCLAHDKEADSYKLHQFLKENASTALNRRIAEIETMLRVSDNEEVFKDFYKRRYDGRKQLMLELNAKVQRKRQNRIKNRGKVA